MNLSIKLIVFIVALLTLFFYIHGEDLESKKISEQYGADQPDSSASTRQKSDREPSLSKSDRTTEQQPDLEKAKALLLNQIGTDELERSFHWDIIENEDGVTNFFGIAKPSPDETQSWEELYEELKNKLPETHRPEFIGWWSRVKRLHCFEERPFRSVSFSEFNDPEKLTHIVVMDANESPSRHTKKWTIVRTFHVGRNNETWPYQHFVEK